MPFINLEPEEPEMEVETVFPWQLKDGTKFGFLVVTSDGTLRVELAGEDERMRNAGKLSREESKKLAIMLLMKQGIDVP